MDRLEADDVKAVGGGARRARTDGRAPRALRLTTSRRRRLASQSHSSEDVTEWVQIRVPAGRYEEIVLDTAWADMECFIGFYAKDRVATSGTAGSHNVAVGTSVHRPSRDGVGIEGWVHTGLGDVPGSNGGWPYMRHVSRVGEKEHVTGSSTSSSAATTRSSASASAGSSGSRRQLPRRRDAPAGPPPPANVSLKEAWCSSTTSPTS
jgi:hypothetical protein